jgi:hypothetical protein
VIGGGARGDDNASEQTVITPRARAQHDDRRATNQRTNIDGWKATMFNPPGGDVSGIRPDVWVVCVPALWLAETAAGSARAGTHCCQLERADQTPSSRFWHARGPDIITFPPIARGTVWRSVAAMMIPTQGGKHTLSDREIVVIARIVEGLTNRAIALELDLSMSTVQAHVA